MGIARLLVAVALACAAAGAHAQDQRRALAYVAPYAGYTHMRIDSGRIYQEPDTLRFDALTFGAAFGFRFPVGFMIEAGHSNAIHANVFDGDDFALTQTYGAVGWRIPFAGGWNFTPKVGRTRWELDADSRILLDSNAERHEGIDGWDNFWEAGLTYDVKERLSLGVLFKDVDQDFGHSRSGTFTVAFAF